MDMTTSRTPSIQFDSILHQLVPNATASPSLEPQQDTRHSLRDSSPGEFPLASIPALVLHILTSCNLEPVDLAYLEATSSFFRQPTNLIPEFELSICEVAALELCRKRSIFKLMKRKEGEELKERCGGSWKLVLMFLLAGEGCYRREKSQVVAGDKHSVIVTTRGDVYTFGLNSSGQLGYPMTSDFWQPRQISFLEGIRIVQAAAAPGRTMLVSDSGQVYAVGWGISEYIQIEAVRSRPVVAPVVMDTLKDIFVVQVVIGTLFIAVLSREGRVYTLCWGDEEKLGHWNDPKDMEPHPLNGALENIPVVQIAAGHCYLLALAFQPNGMSVYSVGCGKGGKLGHGSTTSEKLPQLIEHFQILNIQPTAISGGTWHAAVLGHDGRVCTWGWGNFGCLGHGNEDYQVVPKVVQGLGDGKAIHIATGNFTTFVVLDNGEIYSFGAAWSGNLGHDAAIPTDGQQHMDDAVLSPKLVTSLKDLDEQVVQISLTNSPEMLGHTIALTDSGKVFAFGRGDDGQLGTKLAPGQKERKKPGRIEIDLS